MRPVVALLVLTACGGPDFAPAPVADGSGAREAFATGELRREVFDHRAESPLVDVLFVMDDSISMTSLLGRFQAGFERLAANPDRFPARTRIAVMNTSPADPATLDRPLPRTHPVVGSRSAARRSAGFVGLIDGSGIAAFRRHAPDKADRFPHDGCDAWFAPTDTNEAGVSCLIAHTQISRSGTRAEAGVTALAHLLARSPGKRTFRPGAAVNVVFVSDTHDPGLAPNELDKLWDDAADLVVDRPTYDDLLAAVEADNVVSAFRLHAIAPATECGERWGDGPVYYDLADDAGGVKIDACGDADWGPLLEAIFREGAVATAPVFALGHEPASVREVRVNGRDVPFEVQGEVVRIPSTELPSRRAEVQVTYEVVE